MTKIKIDGKVYCVETLIHERERLIKEVKASAELHRLVLGKIRGEIESEKHIGFTPQDFADGLDKALEIINKYKAEREVEE